VPFVTLKSAMTLDGQLALASPSKGKPSRWITSRESRAEVQRMRHASDALLTGVGTVFADDRCSRIAPAFLAGVCCCG